ncbi:MAG TPA: hypothetical protein PKJ95_01365 [Atribacterota bacterium]|nr:hypothetical protein [Atribacterota bacterium]
MSKEKLLNFSKVVLFTLSFLTIISRAALSFESSQKLFYQGSYSLQQQKINNTVTLKIDYMQEITNDLFFQGDLILRTSNKEYSKPFLIGPNEFYLSAYDVLENLDLKIGQIITRWGAADFFSPLDNFNPAPPELSLTGNQGKIGALGINATYYINSQTYLQAVLLPRLETSPYPDEYLEDSYLTQFKPLYQKQGIDIDAVELSYLPTKNMIWGVQLNHTFPTFDVGLSYYRGYYMDPFPANLDVAFKPTGNIMEVTLSYPARQVLGLEFQGDFPGIEGATLRGDLAYIIPEVWMFQGEKMLEKPYLQTIISADYTTDSNLYLNGGFIYGLPFERGTQCSPYLYLNAKKEITNSDFSPSYTAILSLKDMSMGNAIGIDYQISKNVLATLSYVFISGDVNSKLGILKPSQGFYFSLEWLF